MEEIMEISTENFEQNNENVMVLGASNALEILVQPSNQYADDGQIVAFNVVASGEDLSYLWQVSNDNGATWRDAASVGYDTSCIYFTANVNRNGRLYRCVVTNSNGESVVSSHAQLYVDVVHEEMLVEVLTTNTQILEGVYSDVHLIMVLALLTFVLSCLRGWRRNVVKGAR